MGADRVRAEPRLRTRGRGLIRRGGGDGHGAGDPPDRVPSSLRRGRSGARYRSGEDGAVVKPFIVVGDALLDRDVEGRVERICPEAPVPVVEQECMVARPGGAGLAAALAAADGYEVVLVTALGDDAGGWELEALLAAAGVEVVDLGLVGQTPEKVRVRAYGRLLV